MSKRLLSIDVGNSHTTLGLFDASILSHTWRLKSKGGRSVDELWHFLSSCLSAADITETNSMSVAIASVVPAVTRDYVALSQKFLGQNALVIDHTKVTALKVKYNPPSAVGADRLCGAVAAYKKYGGPAIVADLGTATVFDAIAANGDYLGGAIAPGVATAVEALHAATALLPNVELRFPQSVIGANTEAAIQSGILYGALDLIDGMVSRCQAELGGRAKVIATGGFAELLKPLSRTIDHVEPHLVLDGIRLIADSQ